MKELLRVLSNSAFIAGQKIANGALQFLFFLLLINTFTSDELGLFELGRACLEIGAGVAVPGLALIVLRENSRRKEWWLIQGPGVMALLDKIVLAAATLLFAAVILESFTLTRAGVLGMFCAAIYFQSTCSVYESLFISLNQVQWAMSVNVLCNLAVLGLGAGLVLYFPFPLAGATSALLLRWALNHVLYVRRVRRIYAAMSPGAPSAALSLAELTRDFWPLTLGSVFFILYARIDTIMLEWLGPVSSIAYYSGAFRLAGLLSMIFLSVYQALAPTISRRINRSRPAAFRFVAAIGSLLGALGLMLALLLQGASGRITAWLYPDTYQLTTHALQVMAWTLPITFLGNAFGYFLVNEEKQGIRYYMGINLAGLLINMTGNAILIPTHGFIGAAWMTVATDGLTTLAMVFSAAWIAYGKAGRE